ncbi:nucleotide exchange factor GrpE [Streptomyces sp. AM8-1-1]|uniref:nucleotide exchange factor GrpE n=1 Tax=Streptomyces sp. AM8-1-1 TaxID=3075825 RepID=UPI0028C4D498|nr:nucleotide exchange factor GrpE [Streptomyces sp. AM8-1-1]WNO72179.1 nucleotide exchange factor GrpE [Streptomyces sp. AM8-1-1]
MSTEQGPVTPPDELGDTPPERSAGRPESAESAESGQVPEADDRTAELADLRDRWHRALADLDNLRKRHARELERERGAERARTAAAWLPVLDNLELALVHAGSDSSPVLEGVKAVRDQAVDVLARLGYPRDDRTGVPFDPAEHEVVGVVEAGGAEPNTVVEVVRPGYGAGESQLRPASVVVAKRQE